ncbi:uncharacterized protein isoform X1 [Leptinotarsa decemlineata]|uniref:uncharacterized protein isoform X1 n=1 Tax=Leptinotarsa decemlineata TaxID=7539 RepID=UPI003D30C323
MYTFHLSSKNRLGPTSDLNHDNWDKEEEPEDAGTFKRASEEELKKRVIKTARRKKPIVNEDDSNKKSAFANFTALSKPPVPPSSAFSFLSTITSGSNNEKEEKGKLSDSEKKETDQHLNNKNKDNKTIENSDDKNNEETCDMLSKGVKGNENDATDDEDRTLVKNIEENLNKQADVGTVEKNNMGRGEMGSMNSGEGDTNENSGTPLHKDSDADKLVSQEGCDNQE